MLVAVLVVALIGIAAFSVDFGVAYSGKRQLSTAADAAALAAGQVVATSAPLGCVAGVPVPDLQPGGATYQSALSAARTYLQVNEPGYVTSATPASWFQIGCAGSPGSALYAAGDPTVSVAVDGSSATTLGRITGTNTLQFSGAATAVIGPSGVAAYLLPLAVCASYLTTSPLLPPATPLTTLAAGSIVELDFPKAGTPCATTNNGNWFKIDFPGNNNGHRNFATNLQNGCNCTETLPFTLPPYTGNSPLSAIAGHLNQPVVFPVFQQATLTGRSQSITFDGWVAGTLCEYYFSANSGGGGSAVGPAGDCLTLPREPSDYVGLKINDVVTAGTITTGCRFGGETTCDTVRATVLAK